MTQAQKTFLKNLTETSARALMAKFNHDAGEAFEKGDAAYHGFCVAFEFLNPTSYIQHQNHGGGEHSFFAIDMA
jgi:hypothetical protein